MNSQTLKHEINTEYPALVKRTSRVVQCSRELCLDSQLSISSEHVWVSRGK